MRNIYESPELEVIKFSLNTCVLTASSTVTEISFEDKSDNIIDGDDPGFDPFA